MIKVEHENRYRRLPALITAMKAGELWSGFLLSPLAGDVRVYLRMFGTTSGGLVDVETGYFFSEWTYTELHDARKLEGTLIVKDITL